MISIQALSQMMNNPQVKALMNSNNPQQMALNMLKNSPNANSEIGQNIIKMLENGNMKDIEEYGRNLVKSQGGNPDDIVKMFGNIIK